MGDMAASEHATALRGTVLCAVGVFTHAATKGEGGEGNNVFANAAGVPWSTAPARQDPMGGGVACGAAWRGEA